MLISKFNSVNNVGEQVEKKFNVKLPLSYIKRPEWDLEICRETGFMNIETETLSQEKYWNPFMALRYRTMPTFIVKAQK